MICVQSLLLSAQQKEFENGLKGGKNNDGVYTAFFKKPLDYNKYSKWKNSQKQYIIVDESKANLNYYGNMVSCITKVSFVPKNEEQAYREKEAIKAKKELSERLGISDPEVVLLAHNTLSGRPTYIGYKFVNDSIMQLFFRRNVINDFWIGAQSTYNSEKYGVNDILDYGEINMLHFFRQYPKSTKNVFDYETGKISVTWRLTDTLFAREKNGFIYLPQSFVKNKQQSYQSALLGNIYDVLTYVNKYDIGDDKIETIKDRKYKMLYTVDFFDDQSEKYKFDLYTKTYRDATTWQAKKNFVEQYAKYDASKYVQTILSETPKIHLDKLAAYEQITNQKEFEFWDTGIFGIFSPNFYRNRYIQVAETVYNAIFACEEDIQKTSGGMKDFYQAMAEVLKNYSRYVDDQYLKAVEEYNKVARERRESWQVYRREQCLKCETNLEKTKFAYNEEVDGLFGRYTEKNPGKIAMMNGDDYSFYLDSEGKWYIPGFFFSNTTFNNTQEMLDYFINECANMYCWK